MAAGTSGSTGEKSPSPMSSPSDGGGGGSKVGVIISVVNLLVTIGMVAILFMSFQKEKTKPSIEDMATKSAEGGEGDKEKKGGEEGHGGESAKENSKNKIVEFGKMVTLDQFTVNLSTPGSVNPKFVRVNISLELPNDDVEAEVNSKMPQVRNVVIDLFNSKRASDVSTPEGRDYLKEEIKNALNSFLVNGKVKGVFFTSFALST
ncbi:MAG: flagellar basal body-associated FliL family protein [Bdellovibrio sp.]|nr:flagellar basal body-associated FliL family protein [Bdellovibrio sp.]